MKILSWGRFDMRCVMFFSSQVVVYVGISVFLDDYICFFVLVDSQFFLVEQNVYVFERKVFCFRNEGEVEVDIKQDGKVEKEKCFICDVCYYVWCGVYDGELIKLLCIGCE